MQALVFEGISLPLQLREVPKPIAAAGEVLVQLKAAALNHRDVWIRKGQYAGIELPSILGSDGAGIVAEVGAGAPESLLGREVIINPGMDWGGNPKAHAKEFKILGLPDSGTFAEYVAIPAANVTAKPAHLTWQQSAALPLAGLTAYRALFSRAAVQPGEKVLVTGIGGGVALFALQFALAAGAKVYVTSGSDEKIGRAVQLGATAGANYTQPDWAEQLKTQAGAFDVIIDSAAGDGFVKLVELADLGGRIVFFGGTKGVINGIVPARVFWKQLSVLGTTMGSAAEFAAMVAFVATHRIVPVTSKTFPLAQGNAALDYLEQSSQFGKIVLEIN